MKFNEQLIKAKIRNRYKRFFCDLDLGKDIITAHVPNTGSMKTCIGEGWDGFVSKSNNPKRKLKYTLEMTSFNGELIGVNTSRTNHLVKEALENGVIQELEQYKSIRPEVKVGQSRIDFLLTSPQLKDCYIEVKNVTLKEQSGRASFPDAITTRGHKHLRELSELVKAGHRAVMLFVVQRSHCDSFSIAKEIDPQYLVEINRAKEAGVEVFVYACKLSADEVFISHPLPMVQ